MRWEAIALALLSQALQAGLRPKVDSPGFLPPAAVEGRFEANCQCNCLCGVQQDFGIVAGLGCLAGAGSVAGAWCCCGTVRQVESSPSHRRKGHGIVSRPLSWVDPSSFLR